MKEGTEAHIQSDHPRPHCSAVSPTFLFLWPSVINMRIVTGSFFLRLVELLCPFIRNIDGGQTHYRWCHLLTRGGVGVLRTPNSKRGWSRIVMKEPELSTRSNGRASLAEFPQALFPPTVETVYVRLLPAKSGRNIVGYSRKGLAILDAAP